MLPEAIIYLTLFGTYLIFGIAYIFWNQDSKDSLTFAKYVFSVDPRLLIAIPIGLVISIIVIVILFLVIVLFSIVALFNFYKLRKTESRRVNIEKEHTDAKYKFESTIDAQKRYEGFDHSMVRIELIERIDQRSLGILKGLAYDNILFVCEEPNLFIEKFIEKNYEDIHSRFLSKHPKGESFQFVIPNSKYFDQPAHLSLEQKIKYNYPSLRKDEREAIINELFTISVYDFTRQLKKDLSIEWEIKPGFIRKVPEKTNNTFSYFELPSDSELEIDKSIWFYLSNLRVKGHNIFFSLVAGQDIEKIGKSGQTADFRFNYEAHKISKEIATSIESLKLIGCEELLIQSILNNLDGYVVKKSNKKNSRGKTLSRLVITKEFQIFLSDYDNAEVKMPALSKALFLFFLRHPEGVLLSHLSDHKSELLEIYQTISFRESFDEATSSINELVNPLSNSVNEKASRIKGAFIKLMAEDVAVAYHITGERGEKKQITLDRSLVIWEIVELEWLFEIDPSSEQIDNQEDAINCHYKQALDFLVKKDFRNAEALLSEIIKLNQNHFEAYRLRAVCQIHLFKYQEAENDNNSAILLSAKPGIAYHNRSEARLMLGKYREALDDITKFLREVDNKNAESYYLRGLIHFELGIVEANQDFVNAKILGHQEASRMLQNCSGPIPKELNLEKML